MNESKKTESNARRIEMYAMRLNGFTLEEIGQKYGISKQAVEQFIKPRDCRIAKGESVINLDIREAARDADVKLWEIAEVVGVNDSNFSRRLRRELSGEEKQEIFKIIDAIKQSRRINP